GSIPHRPQERQRIRDAPARRGVDDHELPAERRDLADIAVPRQQSLVESPYFLDERHAPVQAGLRDHIADRFAELHDDALLGLVDDEGGIDADKEQSCQRYGGESEIPAHCASSGSTIRCRSLPRMLRSGSTCPSSITKTEPMRGKVSCNASK